MKKFTTILFILAIAISTAMAQAPQQFKYQAALRDSDGAVMANETVGVQIEILQGSTSGSSVFSETHNVTTTAQGIINLNIGSEADLSTVNWSADTYFIQITVNGTVMGVSQLLSVPYAQFADEAGNTFSGSYTDLANVPANMDTDSTDDFTGNYNDLANKPALSDLAAANNSVNTQLKSVSDPTDAQDATTKAYVDQLKTQIESMNNILLDAGYNGTVMDIDGNTYKTIKIGDQVWMAENLKTTTYNDGTPITLEENGTNWSNLTTEAYCWYENDEATYADTYGALYNWYAVNTGNLCPDGWHVPSDEEWTALEDYIASDGHSGTEGTVLKATSGWIDGNGTDDYSFTALPGGYRYSSGSFKDEGSNGYWWSSTENSSSNAWYRNLNYNNSDVNRNSSYKENGFSVRCLRDN